MTQFLLDTDVLVDFFKKRSYAQQLLATIKEKGDLFLSVLSVSEIRAGWTDEEASYLLPRLYALAKRALVTDEIAQLAGAIRHTYKAKGISLPTVDTLVAATAIENEYQLVTNNRRHYPMKNLSIFPQSPQYN